MLELVDVESREICSLPCESFVNRVIFSADGQTLALGTHLGPRRGTVDLWSSHQGAVRQVASLQTGSVSAVALTSDGDTAVYACPDKRNARRDLLYIQDKESRGTPRLLGGDNFSGHLESISALAIGNHDQFLATASLDGSVKIWSLVELRRHAGMPLIDTVGTPREAMWGRAFSRGWIY